MWDNLHFKPSKEKEISDMQILCHPSLFKMEHPSNPIKADAVLESGSLFHQAESLR